jgi:hypothetical protein
VEEKILTQPPDPTKKGVQISQAKYEQVRSALGEALHEQGALDLAQQNEAVSQRLQGRFEGSIL